MVDAANVLVVVCIAMLLLQTHAGSTGRRIFGYTFLSDIDGKGMARAVHCSLSGFNLLLVQHTSILVRTYAP
jgi:hypothetical protein